MKACAAAYRSNQPLNKMDNGTRFGALRYLLEDTTERVWTCVRHRRVRRPGVGPFRRQKIVDIL